MSFIGNMEPLDPEKGDFEVWMEKFNLFCHANKISGEHRQSSFLSLISVEIYASLRIMIAPKKPVDVDFEEIIEKVRRLVKGKRSYSVVAERSKFKSRVQREDEGISQFIRDLQKRSETCEFGDRLQEELRDQIAHGVRETPLRKKLFEEPNCTYEQVMEIINIWEDFRIGSESEVGSPARLQDLANGFCSDTNANILWCLEVAGSENNHGSRLSKEIEKTDEKGNNVLKENQSNDEQNEEFEKDEENNENTVREDVEVTLPAIKNDNSSLVEIPVMVIYPHPTDVNVRLETTITFNKDVIKMPHCVYIYSPSCMLGNYPWRIKISRPRKFGDFRFFLKCDGDSKDPDWQCHATAELIVVSQNKGVENVVRQAGSHRFCEKEDDWGYIHFIPWLDLIDPDNHYIKDNTVTFKIQVKIGLDTLDTAVLTPASILRKKGKPY